MGNYNNPPYYLTAYGLAVKHGYQGTEEEFVRDIYGGAARADAAADAAENSAEAASGSEEAAAASASDSEAYGAGTRGGEPVEEDDPAYQNNAEYYAGKAKEYSDHIGDPVNGIVTEWLGQNISQETGYVLDRNLASSEAAAPADLVGDLKSALVDSGDYNLIVGGNRANITTQGVTFTWNDNKTVCTVNGTNTSSTSIAVQVFLGSTSSIPYGMEAGETYYVSVKSTNSKVQLGFYFYVDGTYSSGAFFYENGKLTIPETTTGVRVLVGLRAGQTAVNDTISELRVQKYPYEVVLEDLEEVHDILKTYPILPILWEQGTLTSTGEESASDYAIRSKGFIVVDDWHNTIWPLFARTVLPTGINSIHMLIYEYTTVGQSASKYTTITNKTARPVALDPNTRAVRFVMKSYPLNTVAFFPEMSQLCALYWGNSPLFDKISNMDYNTGYALEWEFGRLTTSGEPASSDTICRTSLASVTPGDIIVIAQPSRQGSGVFWYADGIFDSYVPVGEGSQAKLGVQYYTVPSGVNGFRLAHAQYDVTPFTPEYCATHVYVASMTGAYMGLLHGTQDGVYHEAKLRSFGNSLMTGTVYPNGSIGYVVSFDDAPYAGVARALGIEQKNTDHTLLSSTGFLHDAGNGSFLENIKATDITAYDYLLTQFNTGDMGTYPVGAIETSTAGDGTLVGGVLELLNYVRSTNALCNVVLVSVVPSSITAAGEGIFNARFGNGSTIAEFDAVMHQLAEKEHFIFVDWQDMYLSYHYQEYTFESNNIHFASREPYRTMSEYLGRKVCKNSSIFACEHGIFSPIWGQGRLKTADGTEIASTNNIRTNVIPVNGITALYIYTFGMFGYVYWYDDNMSFISYTDMYRLPAKVSVPEGASYARVVCRNVGSEDITPKRGDGILIADADGDVIQAAVGRGESNYSEPMITIIDDDSNERFYNDLYEVFKTKSEPISTAVITGRIGNSGYMNWEQVEECYTNGVEILSHTNRHFLSTDADYNTLTVDEITKDYRMAKNILGMHGINAELLVFSGSTGLNARFQTAAERVYTGGILAGDNRRNMMGGNPYQIRRYRIGNQTDYHCDLDVLKGLVDLVKSSGGWMIWMTHTSGGASAWAAGTDEGSSAYILGQAVDYATAQGVPVVTAEYGFKKYFSRWNDMLNIPYSS